MTITFSVWWIPAVLSAVMVLRIAQVMYYREYDSADWAGVIASFSTVWMIFFAVMYFCKEGGA